MTPTEWPNRRWRAFAPDGCRTPGSENLTCQTAVVKEAAGSIWLNAPPLAVQPPITRHEMSSSSPTSMALLNLCRHYGSVCRGRSIVNTQPEPAMSLMLSTPLFALTLR